MEKARGILQRIYKPESLEAQVRNLEIEVEALKEETKLSEKDRLKELFTTYKKCVIIGCGLQAA